MLILASRLLCKLFVKQFFLAILNELVDVEAGLVVSVQVLGKPVRQLNATCGELGKLVNYQAHLESCIACEALICVCLYYVECPRIKRDHIVTQFSHFDIVYLTE